jgi:hypothetical protein
MPMLHLSLVDSTILSIAGSWIFSALVDSMNAPTAQSSDRYRYAYSVLHKLAGNLKRATEERFGRLAADAPAQPAQGA